MQAPHRLALGTVQFGVPYGISNSSGQTPPSEVRAILDRAHAVGIDTLDTAYAYGESEKVLGEARAATRFTIVTKTKALVGGAISEASLASIEAAFQESLQRLGTSQIDSVLVHHGNDLLRPGGERLVEKLEAWRAAGWIRRWGASVYSPEECTRIFQSFSIQSVQLPCSLLDQRFLPLLPELRQRGIEVHARSLFLQGLWLMDPAQLTPYFTSLRPKLAALRAAVQAEGITPLEAALAFAQQTPHLSRTLVGVNSLVQFEQILTAWNKIASQPPRLRWAEYALTEEKYLNPALWPKENT